MMTQEIDKRERAQIFRQRLREAMARNSATQSGLARRVGVERSTLSQLLRDEGPRLPNAQLVAECARALGCSADWLLGLTALPEQAADLMAQAIEITAAPRALVDEQIFHWHQEAAGYKIRHVPAGLPDIFKTTEMLRWEYAPELGRTVDQAIGASKDRLDWLREARSDNEIAMPLHELQAFATSTGYYNALPADIRLRQIDRMLALYEQLFPKVRITLYDARRLFSAPVTIFGPLLAVIYLGRKYIAFRDEARVSALTEHFNSLVREAIIQDHAFPDHLMSLRQIL